MKWTGSGKYSLVMRIMVVIFLTVFPLLAQDTTDGKETNPDLTASPIQDTGKIGKETSAQEGDSPLTDTPTKLPESISFFQTLMALSFVLGLIFLSAYLFKKMMGIKTGNFRATRVSITPVGNLSLGEKKFLTVVTIQGKYYFLGITPTTISMLSELELELPDETEVPSGSDFGSIFQKARTLLQHGPSQAGKIKKL